ncbi:hypothetical protein N7449_001986 [Penicillium cf. viridicatum]|uniref:Uncharacterized protein n=1 Tax=Penicillium cf. viridicatum TaxID=2972119 RepID=A0A9W9MUE9_9EURO|nr:hypothetical protein N7449_001986 [Penicillium cf. viridicatum]
MGWLKLWGHWVRTTVHKDHAISGIGVKKWAMVEFRRLSYAICIGNSARKSKSQSAVLPKSSNSPLKSGNPPSGTNRMRPGIADRPVRLLVDVGLGTAGLPHQNGS